MSELVRLIEVLMVEDSETDALLTRESFAESRVANNLHVTQTGEEALDFLFRRPPYEDAPTPDLILLDLNLPKMSGHDVLEEIKRHESLRLIPVVVLTTSEAEEDILRSYGLNANSYVTKPIGFENLKTALRAIEDFWFGIVQFPGKADGGASTV